MNANKNCVDMNECLHASENNFDDVAICSNTLGSYSCTRNSGYVGNGVICEDVNECSDGVHSCDTNAKCLNTDGSYQCECLNGFVGDGSFCDDVNECAADSANDCVEHSFCTNTYGSYICSCKPGYGVAVDDVKEISPLDSSAPILMNAKIILVTPIQVVKILMAVLHVLVILDSSVMVSLVKMLMNAKAITIVMAMLHASIGFI